MERPRLYANSAFVASLAGVALCACSSATAPSPTAGTGGIPPLGSGGSMATGGASATGGMVSAGGAANTGGAPLSGGVATAGATSSATGGRVSGFGGTATGAGGLIVAGASMGGVVTNGGSLSAGGAGAGGVGGMASAEPSGDPIPSTGCGATPTTTSCNTQNSPCTVDVAGTERKFWVQLPDQYDPKRAYPVVFEYHPLGGNGWQGLTMYQIRRKFPNAIYVSPDGLKSGQYQGFSNTDGEDEAMTRAIMTDLESKYCIDKGRYFSTGFSFGGSMSYTAACNMSDVFRAIGAMSGAPISGAKCTSKQPARPVAVWATHGDMDTALPITLAEPIIEALVKYNGCSAETKPVDPSPCVEYQNCSAGYPVVWCPRAGDTHAIPSFGATAIAKFFQQF